MKLSLSQSQSFYSQIIVLELTLFFYLSFNFYFYFSRFLIFGHVFAFYLTHLFLRRKYATDWEIIVKGGWNVRNICLQKPAESSLSLSHYLIAICWLTWTFPSPLFNLSGCVNNLTTQFQLYHHHHRLIPPIKLILYSSWSLKRFTTSQRGNETTMTFLVLKRLLDSLRMSNMNAEDFFFIYQACNLLEKGKKKKKQFEVPKLIFLSLHESSFYHLLFLQFCLFTSNKTAPTGMIVNIWQYYIQMRCFIINK